MKVTESLRTGIINREGGREASMRKIVIGSRDSRLAVVQSEMVRDFILEKHPDMEV